MSGLFLTVAYGVVPVPPSPEPYQPQAIPNPWFDNSDAVRDERRRIISIIEKYINDPDILAQIFKDIANE